MVECEWFHECHEASAGVAEHPTLGDVEICQDHIYWLQHDFSQTKLLPPMVARRLTADPQLREALGR